MGEARPSVPGRVAQFLCLFLQCSSYVTTEIRPSCQVPGGTAETSPGAVWAGQPRLTRVRCRVPASYTSHLSPLSRVLLVGFCILATPWTLHCLSCEDNSQCLALTWFTPLPHVAGIESEAHFPSSPGSDLLPSVLPGNAPHASYNQARNACSSLSYCGFLQPHAAMPVIQPVHLCHPLATTWLSGSSYNWWEVGDELKNPVSRQSQRRNIIH